MSNNNIRVKLSLAVREKLMRGLYDEAVQLIMVEYKVEQDYAERFVEKYKNELRERKTELELQRMQHEAKKEAQSEKQKYIRYAAWSVVAIVFIALVWLIGSAVTQPK